MAADEALDVGAAFDTLARLAPDAARAWLAEHPQLRYAVATTEPEVGGLLWQRLAERSVPDGSGGWATGPLAILGEVAPGILGALNGVPIAQRSRWNLAHAAALIAGSDLSDTNRDTLVRVVRSVRVDDTAGEARHPLLLLGCLPDHEGHDQVRAVIAVGDIENAAAVAVLTHGIMVTTRDAPRWVFAAGTLTRRVDAELRARGTSLVRAESAAIVFFGWDAGGLLTVTRNSLADAGAALLGPLLSQIRRVNPDAPICAVVHSYGSTMIGQLILSRPTLIDRLFAMGSAGMTEAAAAVMATRISDGTLTVVATQSDRDHLAEQGRLPLLSEHRVDPRTIPGATALRANWRMPDPVPGRHDEVFDPGPHPYRLDSGATVEAFSVDGHAAIGYHDDSTWITETTRGRGYLDDHTLSAWQAVDTLADALGDR